MEGGYHLSSGMVIGGDFKILRALSEGGMGAVFVAEQLSTGSQRAVKVMHPQLVRDPQLRRRFEQEARASARIKSDHVVQVVGAGVDGPTGIPFIAMELLDGQDLASLLASRGPLPPAELWAVFAQLCHALTEAHSAGIVHRDLKPENVFLQVARREGVPFTLKVLDFGIAKMVADAQVTATAAVGTPLWMAPEQTEHGAPVSPQTDLWALGLLAFKLLTGKHYWRNANGPQVSATTLLREVVLDPLVPASARAAELGCGERIPPAFDGWFSRCVAREVVARFPTASEARASLAAALGVDPQGGGRPSLEPGWGQGAQAAEGERTAALDATTPFDALGATGLAASADAAPAAAPPGAPPAAQASGPAASARSGAKAAEDEPEDEPARPPPAGAPAWVLPAGIAVVLALGAAGVIATRTSGGAAPLASVGAQPSPSAAGWTSCPSGMVKVEGAKVTLAGAGELAVETFCLDRAEVTVEAYAACVAGGRCTPPAQGVDAPSMTDEERRRWSPFCNGLKPDRQTHPVNCVSAAQAVGYCIAQGKRLPFEAEWQLAAQGGADPRVYPWGTAAPEAQLCWSGASDRLGAAAGTCPSGSYPQGASAQGLLDLAGNVAEWTQSPFREGTTDLAVRGGSWADDAALSVRAAYREKRAPLARSATVGFRCAWPSR